MLLLIMLFSGVAELVSLGSVLPFLGVLSDPNLLWQHPLIGTLARRAGLISANQLLLPTTLVFSVSVVFAAAIRLTNLWLNGRIAAAVGSDLSCEAYRRTLYQPYSVHVQRNSADIITNITSQIYQTVIAINAFLSVVTSAVVSIGLIVGLILIDSSAALLAIVTFGAAYVFLALTARYELKSNGHKMAQALRLQLKALQEGLGAIREVLLDGTQELYLESYTETDRVHRRLEAKNVFLSFYPRYALEAMGLVFIAILGVIHVIRTGSEKDILPILGALALGAQRLLPALQQIYSGWAALKASNAAIIAVMTMLSQPLPIRFRSTKPLELQRKIRLSEVSFSYGSEHPRIINNLTLEINKGQRVGIVGSTGSGKTTLVDLLMGLLSPTYGKLMVDGLILDIETQPELVSAWRSSIAHVPQVIYMADSSIAENIAFGHPRDGIDIERVKLAAKQARISDFIESKPQSYESFVGERGVQLSGGQRQRIGIARALYKQSQILVFDEATSALDESTESQVMDTIENLSEALTVIIIAHRTSTLRKCDRVIKIDNGKIVADGPPATVLASS